MSQNCAVREDGGQVVRCPVQGAWHGVWSVARLGVLSTLRCVPVVVVVVVVVVTLPDCDIAGVEAPSLCSC